MTAQAPARRFTVTGIAAFAGVGAAGVAFALLLLLVHGNWKPLESLDHNVAAELNSFVFTHPVVEAALKAVTTMGNTAVLFGIVGVIALALVVRHRSRLAAYLVVTGVGAIIMGPALKLFVGRLRPVVEHTVALAPGNSFPSGHALGSIVCYGAIALVFLPAVHRWGRRILLAAMAVLVVLIGFSRIALGVHFLSDVVGGWLLGAVWLAVTARAFETWRTQLGRRPTAPLREGLEPEAARDVQPAPVTDPAPTAAWRRVTAGLLVAWVLTFGIVLTLGQAVKNTKNVLGDHTIPLWFSQHRTPTLTTLSDVGSTIGATPTIIAMASVIVVLILALARLWRPAVFVVIALIGEVVMFVAVVAIINRSRPDVPRLDPHLPTSSYPSGHLAATICLYGSATILVMASTRHWWRWLAVALAVLAPLAVAWARLYRGMHHPTDLLGSVVLSGLWLTSAYLLIRPTKPLTLPSTRTRVARELTSH